MKDPQHPGVILSENYLKPLGLSATDAANRMMITPKHVYAVVRGENRVTPWMAQRLGIVFGPNAAYWVNLQAQYDIWELERTPIPRELKHAVRIRRHPTALTTT